MWQVTLATALLLAISALAIVLRKKRPYVFTGWFWYVGMLVPVIGIVQIGEQGHADRYTYLPYIGLFLLIVCAAADLATTWHLRRQYLWLVASTAIAVLSYLAAAQTSFWKNSEILWRHALANTSLNPLAQANLGDALMRKGQLDDAIVHFRKVLRTNPDFAEANNSLGYVLMKKGQPDEAVAYFRKALEINPGHAEANNNLGYVLMKKGQIGRAHV